MVLSEISCGLKYIYMIYILTGNFSRVETTRALAIRIASSANQKQHSPSGDCQPQRLSSASAPSISWFPALSQTLQRQHGSICQIRKEISDLGTQATAASSPGALNSNSENLRCLRKLITDSVADLDELCHAFGQCLERIEAIFREAVSDQRVRRRQICCNDWTTAVSEPADSCLHALAQSNHAMSGLLNKTFTSSWKSSFFFEKFQKDDEEGRYRAVQELREVNERILENGRALLRRVEEEVSQMGLQPRVEEEVSIRQ